MGNDETRVHETPLQGLVYYTQQANMIIEISDSQGLMLLMRGHSFFSDSQITVFAWSDQTASNTCRSRADVSDSADNRLAQRLDADQ